MYRWEIARKMAHHLIFSQLITFHFKMKTRCLITSGHIINSYIFLMNEFDIIIMPDWLLVFTSPYFLHVWPFSRIS